MPLLPFYQLTLFLILYQMWFRIQQFFTELSFNNPLIIDISPTERFGHSFQYEKKYPL